MREETTRPPQRTPGSLPRQGKPLTDSAILRLELPAEAAAAPATARIGHFIPVSRLGAGGMGEVWKAWDTRIGRWVALKLLRGSDEREAARFAQEAQLAGKLSHPHIAAVHEVGEAAGRPFIAMQFIDGVTLSRFQGRDRRLVARVLRDAALAVEEAHRQGVIHRDLKPDNVMVRGEEEPHVFVMDFGLARPLEREVAMSTSGSVIGTPAYMPPEQARAGEVDARADVYSLGATLYELLTGRPPFLAKQFVDLVRMVLEDEPPGPRTLNPSIEPDLEVIVLKCLEKDRERRYGSAAALAEDLTRFLEGEPILARPASLVYRLARKVKKRRGVLGIGAVALAAVVVALAVAIPAQMREAERREETQRALDLWVRISGLMSEAEVLARAGKMEATKRKREEGAEICRAHLAKSELAEARYFLGRLLKDLGRFAEAKAEFTRAIELKPGLGEARAARGLILAEEYRDRATTLGLEISSRRGQDGSVAPASFEEVEVVDPSLRDLKQRVLDDLGVPIGATSYFKPADLLFGLALIDRLQKRLPQARAALERVLEMDPAYVRAVAELGWIDVEQDLFLRGVERARAAIDLHRGDYRSYRLLGTALLFAQTHSKLAPEAPAWLAEADAALRTAIELGDPTAAVHETLGMVALLRQDSRTAIEEATRALELSPFSFKSYVNRGNARAMAGDRKGALEDFDVAVARMPLSALARMERGNVRVESGDAGGAMEDYTEALRINPRQATAACYRASLHADAGRFDAALEDYALALSIDPRHVRALNDRGNVHFSQRRFGQSIEDYTAAIESNPLHYPSWYNRGHARERLGKHDLALADYDEAVRLRPDFGIARMRRAHLLVDLGRPDPALADFNWAVEKKHDLASAYFGRGNAQSQKGEHKRAAEDFRASLEIEPSNPEGWNNLGTTLTRLGKFRDAEDCFDRLVTLEPADPQARASRGQLRQQRGNIDGAVADYSKALELAPPDWNHRAALEAVLKRLKR